MGVKADEVSWEGQCFYGSGPKEVCYLCLLDYRLFEAPYLHPYVISERLQVWLSTKLIHFHVTMMNTLTSFEENAHGT